MKNFSLCCCGKTSKYKVLLALDFDDTVISANTDYAIQKAADAVPDSIRQLHGQDRLEYLQALFNYFNELGFRMNDYRKCLTKIPFVKGMLELLKNVKQMPNSVETVILSDSNSLFIQMILENQQLQVDQIISNPAKFDGGCFKIEPYHRQSPCMLSSPTLCKGQALSDYVKSRGEEGVLFRRIVYVGNGRNDLCPVMRLRDKDVAAVRKGSALHHMLKEDSARKEGPNIQLAAKVVTWESGLELMRFLKDRI